MKVFWGILVYVFSCCCTAGELVNTATIIEVVSNGTNGKNFGIKITGGVGTCAGDKWIYFWEDQAPSVTSYNQSFALALVAFSSGKTVRVHHYSKQTCSEADFISVSR